MSDFEDMIRQIPGIDELISSGKLKIRDFDPLTAEELEHLPDIDTLDRDALETLRERLEDLQDDLEDEEPDEGSESHDEWEEALDTITDPLDEIEDRLDEPEGESKA